MTTQEILALASKTRAVLPFLTEEKKNDALLKMADSLEKHTEDILIANKADLKKAEGTVSDVMLDRLRLSEARIKDMAEGIRAVSSLPDPVGRILEERTLENGLNLKKISVSLGVIGIIYESRPNVTSDAAALSLKSGSVCVLRGGKEAFFSSFAIVKALKEGLKEADLPETLINLIEDPSRESAYELMRARGYIDMLIPRGGASLIRSTVENSLVPFIETGTGICTVYVDESADTDMALKIIENAKTSRPSVCNAEEVLLIHEKIAGDFLPKLKRLLVDDRIDSGKIPVELRLSENVRDFIPGTPASETDFDTEFLDYILAVKAVKDVGEAIKHINAHTTHHSEAVIAKDAEVIRRFTTEIDSACLYVNASTRFTDGGCFALGCEMGISTQKLHARGPMGLSELTSYKYIVTGNGQTR